MAGPTIKEILLKWGIDNSNWKKAIQELSSLLDKANKESAKQADSMQKKLDSQKSKLKEYIADQKSETAQIEKQIAALKVKAATQGVAKAEAVAKLATEKAASAESVKQAALQKNLQQIQKTLQSEVNTKLMQEKLVTAEINRQTAALRQQATATRLAQQGQRRGGGGPPGGPPGGGGGGGFGGMLAGILGGGAFGTITAAVASAEGLEHAIEGIIEKLKELAKEVGPLQQLREQFEKLAPSRGINPAEFMDKLRVATKGVVGDLQLYRQANTFLQSSVHASEEDIISLTTATVGLARAQGRDATAAVQALQRFFLTGRAQTLAYATGIQRAMFATQGMGQGLDATLKSTKQFQQALEVIKAQYEAIGEPAQTYTGALTKLGVQTHRLFEEFMLGVEKSKGFQALVTWINQLAERIGALSEKAAEFGKEVGDWFGASFQNSVVIIDALFEALSDAVKIVWDTVKGLAASFSWLSAALPTSSIAEITDRFSSLRGIIATVGETVVVLIAGFRELANWLKFIGGTSIPQMEKALIESVPVIGRITSLIDRLFHGKSAKDTLTERLQETLKKEKEIADQLQAQFDKLEDIRTGGEGKSDFKIHISFAASLFTAQQEADITKKIAKVQEEITTVTSKVQLDITKRRIADEEELLKMQYAQGLVSHEEYLDKKRALDKEEFDATLTQLKAEFDAKEKYLEIEQSETRILNEERRVNAELDYQTRLAELATQRVRIGMELQQAVDKGKRGEAGGISEKEGVDKLAALNDQYLKLNNLIEKSRSAALRASAAEEAQLDAKGTLQKIKNLEEIEKARNEYLKKGRQLTQEEINDEIAARQKLVDAEKKSEQDAIERRKQILEKEFQEGIVSSNEYLAERVKAIDDEYNATEVAAKKKLEQNKLSLVALAQFNTTMVEAASKREKQITQLTDNEWDIRIKAADAAANRLKSIYESQLSYQQELQKLNPYTSHDKEIQQLNGLIDLESKRLRILAEQERQTRDLPETWAKVKTEIDRTQQDLLKYNEQLIKAKDYSTAIAEEAKNIATAASLFPKGGKLAEAFDKVAQTTETISKLRQQFESRVMASKQKPEEIKTPAQLMKSLDDALQKSSNVTAKAAEDSSVALHKYDEVIKDSQEALSKSIKDLTDRYSEQIKSEAQATTSLDLMTAAVVKATKELDKVEAPDEKKETPEPVPEAKPISTGSPDLRNLVRQISQKIGVDTDLVNRVIKQESNWDVNAKSKKGAQGLMQLMPATQQQYGVTDPFNAQQNITAGVTELHRLLNVFDQDVNKALAAYNAGQGNISKGIYPKETKEYVAKITEGYKPPSELADAINWAKTLKTSEETAASSLDKLKTASDGVAASVQRRVDLSGLTEHPTIPVGPSIQPSDAHPQGAFSDSDLQSLEDSLRSKLPGGSDTSSLPPALNAAGTAAENAAKALEELATVAPALSSAVKDAEKQLGDLANKPAASGTPDISKAASGTETALQSLGKGFTNFKDNILGTILGEDGLTGAFQKLGSDAEGASKDFGNFMSGVQLVAGMVGNVLQTFKAATPAAGAIQGAQSFGQVGNMIAGPLGGIIGAAVGAIVGAISGAMREAAVKMAKTLTATFKATMAEVAAGTQTLSAGIQLEIKNIQTAVQKLSGKKNKDLLKSILPGMEEGLQQLQLQQKQIIQSFDDQLNVINNPQAYQAHLQAIDDVIKKYREYIQAGGSVVNANKFLQDSFKNIVADNLSQLNQYEQDAVQNALQYNDLLLQRQELIVSIASTEESQQQAAIQNAIQENDLLLQKQELDNSIASTEESQQQGAIQNAIKINDLTFDRQKLIQNTNQQLQDIMSRGVAVRQMPEGVTKAREIQQLMQGASNQLMDLNNQIDTSQHQFDIQKKIYDLTGDRYQLTQKLTAIENKQTDTMIRQQQLQRQSNENQLESLNSQLAVTEHQLAIQKTMYDLAGNRAQLQDKLTGVEELQTENMIQQQKLQVQSNQNQMDNLNQQIAVSGYKLDAERQIFNLANTRVGLETELTSLQNQQTNLTLQQVEALGKITSGLMTALPTSTEGALQEFGLGANYISPSTEPGLVPVPPVKTGIAEIDTQNQLMYQQALQAYKLSITQPIGYIPPTGIVPTTPVPTSIGNQGSFTPVWLQPGQTYGTSATQQQLAALTGTQPSQIISPQALSASSSFIEGGDKVGTVSTSRGTALLVSGVETGSGASSALTTGYETTSGITDALSTGYGGAGYPQIPSPITGIPISGTEGGLPVGSTGSIIPGGGTVQAPSLSATGGISWVAPPSTGLHWDQLPSNVLTPVSQGGDQYGVIGTFQSVLDSLRGISGVLVGQVTPPPSPYLSPTYGGTAPPYLNPLAPLETPTKGPGPGGILGILSPIVSGLKTIFAPILRLFGIGVDHAAAAKASTTDIINKFNAITTAFDAGQLAQQDAINQITTLQEYAAKTLAGEQEGGQYIPMLAQGMQTALDQLQQGQPPAQSIDSSKFMQVLGATQGGISALTNLFGAQQSSALTAAQMQEIIDTFGGNFAPAYWKAAVPSLTQAMQTALASATTVVQQPALPPPIVQQPGTNLTAFGTLAFGAQPPTPPTSSAVAGVEVPQSTAVPQATPVSTQPTFSVATSPVVVSQTMLDLINQFNALIQKANAGQYNPLLDNSAALYGARNALTLQATKNLTDTLQAGGKAQDAGDMVALSQLNPIIDQINKNIIYETPQGWRESTNLPTLPTSFTTSVTTLVPAVQQLSTASSQLSTATSQLAPAATQLSVAVAPLAPATSQLSVATEQLAPATSSLSVATAQLAPATSQLSVATSQLSAAGQALVQQMPVLNQAGMTVEQINRMAANTPAPAIAPPTQQLVPIAKKVTTAGSSTGLFGLSGGALAGGLALGPIGAVIGGVLGEVFGKSDPGKAARTSGQSFEDQFNVIVKQFNAGALAQADALQQIITLQEKAATTLASEKEGGQVVTQIIPQMQAAIDKLSQGQPTPDSSKFLEVLNATKGGTKAMVNLFGSAKQALTAPEMQEIVTTFSGSHAPDYWKAAVPALTEAMTTALQSVSPAPVVQAPVVPPPFTSLPAGPLSPVTGLPIAPVVPAPISTPIPVKPSPPPMPPQPAQNKTQTWTDPQGYVWVWIPPFVEENSSLPSGVFHPGFWCLQNPPAVGIPPVVSSSAISQPSAPIFGTQAVATNPFGTGGTALSSALATQATSVNAQVDVSAQRLAVEQQIHSLSAIRVSQETQLVNLKMQEIAADMQRIQAHAQLLGMSQAKGATPNTLEDLFQNTYETRGRQGYGRFYGEISNPT